MKRLLGAVLALSVLPLAALGQAENPNVAHGFAPEKVYHFDNVDAVNIFNGNLNIVLPIGQAYPVGGKVSYGLTLTYGGNNWVGATRDYQRWESLDAGWV